MVSNYNHSKNENFHRNIDNNQYNNNFFSDIDKNNITQTLLNNTNKKMNRFAINSLNVNVNNNNNNSTKKLNSHSNINNNTSCTNNNDKFCLPTHTSMEDYLYNNDSKIRNREILIKKGAGERFGAVLVKFSYKLFVAYVTTSHYIAHKSINIVNNKPTNVNNNYIYSDTSCEDSVSIDNNNKQTNVNGHTSSEGSVYKQTPAFRAGLVFGDELTHINGDCISKLTLKQIHDILNSSVEIEIKVKECKYVTIEKRKWSTSTLGNTSKNKEKKLFFDAVGVTYKNGHIESVMECHDSVVDANKLLPGERIVGVNGKSVLCFEDNRISKHCNEQWQGKNTSNICLTVLPVGLANFLQTCIPRSKLFINALKFTTCDNKTK
eukprot:Pgem_evm1s4260